MEQQTAHLRTAFWHYKALGNSTEGSLSREYYQQKARHLWVYLYDLPV